MNLISVIKNDFDNANKLMGKDKDTNEDLEINMEREIEGIVGKYNF
ncbi:hypothetical protein O5404_05160 (plasmid) [Borrelia miyamotoi]|uniref:Uncharacterized protein n=1 Tax=Borrelia miyamotoi TaxID=47466 RepID=A0AAX3JP52_9SPIR|nr:hypothetical protein [Borrelia miyamotoi]WAZ72413.1 hypothetical protein O5404_05160 [Borrelia miyamotoi]WVI05335.1 hypothetical protein F9Y91_00520 [Borrelia miyamotoi]